MRFKGTVSVIDLPYKDDIARFTSVTFIKLCLVKYELHLHVFVSLNCVGVYFHMLFLSKSDLRISCLLKTKDKFTESNTFRVRKKQRYLPHFCLD